MKRRFFPSMAVGVIGTRGRIAFAGDAASLVDTRTINPDSSGPTNVRDAAGGPVTRGG